MGTGKSAAMGVPERFLTGLASSKDKEAEKPGNGSDQAADVAKEGPGKEDTLLNGQQAAQPGAQPGAQPRAQPGAQLGTQPPPQGAPAAPPPPGLSQTV